MVEAPGSAQDPSVCLELPSKPKHAEPLGAARFPSGVSPVIHLRAVTCAALIASTGGPPPQPSLPLHVFRVSVFPEVSPL